MRIGKENKKVTNLKELYRRRIENRGITLVALIVTIVVLLILAGVSIGALTNRKGLIQEAHNSADQAQRESIIQKIQADLLNLKTKTGETPTKNDLINIIKENDYAKDEPGEDSFISKDGEYEISYQEISGWSEGASDIDGVTVPGGFTHVESEGRIKEDGIVVADNFENEYVWIPVTKNEDGTPTEPYVETNGKLREGSNIEIQLGRYDFNATTGVTDALNGYTEDTSSNHNSSYGNQIAKSIEDFKQSVNKNGGYYISRFEAGVENYTNFNTSEMTNFYTAPNDDWTAYSGENINLVSKSGAKIWNYITQKRAATLCRNLAEANGYIGVTSDLINSYAWDTALVFIQECGTDSSYSNQAGQSTTSSDASDAGEAILANGEGTGKTDKQCNIYDMAGNCREWTTETSSNSYGSCVLHGGYYYLSDTYAGTRTSVGTTNASSYDSFRSILYY